MTENNVVIKVTIIITTIKNPTSVFECLELKYIFPCTSCESLSCCWLYFTCCCFCDRNPEKYKRNICNSVKAMRSLSIMWKICLAAKYVSKYGIGLNANANGDTIQK